MYGNYTIRMSIASNGYIVTYSDPSIVEKNRKEDGYTDPDVSVVYKDEEEMAEGVAKLVPLLAAAMKKDTDYDAAISEAISADSSED